MNSGSLISLSSELRATISFAGSSSRTTASIAPFLRARAASIPVLKDLIDFAHVVIAPVLVGGHDTPTLIDGDAISIPSQLSAIRPMKLQECNALNDSYVQLRYEVIHRDSVL